MPTHPTKKLTSKNQSGARVLTSLEYMKIVEEKEKKKKDEIANERAEKEGERTKESSQGSGEEKKATGMI